MSERDKTWPGDDEAKVTVCQVFIRRVFCFTKTIRERTECPKETYTELLLSDNRDNRGYYLLSEIYLNELCICNF